jgi:hypothetical protein
MAYTYYLRNKITGEKYYGVRYAKNCDPVELWETYFSSSKLVAERIKEYGVSSFDFEIRRVFLTPKQARDWEERVLRRLDVLHRVDWLNQNICGKFLKEGPQSPEHIFKRVRRMIITNNKKGWPKRGSLSDMERQKVSERFKGIPKSPEHIAHMKCHENNRKLVRCPHCKKQGQYVNMKRWHFENCKSLGKPRKLYTCPHCGACKALPGVMRYHFNNCKWRKTNGREAT